MEFKILRWLKKWAAEHGYVLKDWQQVSPTHWDVWYITSSDFSKWGDFCPRKYTNIEIAF